MQADHINRLRSRWGALPCDHPCVEKIFETGEWTGHYGCAICGEMFKHRPQCAPAQTFELVVVAGSGKGKRLVVSAHGEFLVGSDSPCQVRLSDSGVSRLHCKLRSTDNGLFVCDMGSRTGTLVNDSPIQEETLLRPGDILAIGSFRFELASRSTSIPTGPSTPVESTTATADAVVEPAIPPVPQNTEPPPAATARETKAAPTTKRTVRVYRRYWDVAVVRFSTPRVERHNMATVLQELATLIDAESVKKIVINFTDVEYTHIRAIAQLIRVRRELSDVGGALWLCCLPPDLKAMIVSAGLAKVLDISDDEYTAVDVLADREVGKRETDEAMALIRLSGHS